MQPFWIWRSDATKSHTIHHQRVTPLVQSIGLRWPRGGWLWQFPLAVEVEDQRTGAQQRVPIRDTTRLARWLMAALTMLVVVAATTSWRRGKSRRKVY